MSALPPVVVKNNGKRNSKLIYLTIGLLLIGLIWLLIWFFYLRFYESTDDAYVNGYLINVTSVVDGTPIAYYADDTDLVEEGQLLVRLDPTPFQVTFDQELATLATTARQVKQIYDQVAISRASLQEAQKNYEQAVFDYENRKNLVHTEAVSQEDYIHSKTNFEIAELNIRKASSTLIYVESAAGDTPMQLHPLITSQREKVKNAFYRLQHTTIYAPARGHIAQRAVEVGQRVSAGMPLMAIVPQAGMWIDANFKETQLTSMRVGQPATIKIDLYGRKAAFTGTVLGISSGTGSVFSVIPPQNATGNWIKIVQRLAVRIGLNPEHLKEYPLRLGLSAVVRVNISDTELPPLVETVRKAPIATTQVYDLDFKELDNRMDQIINNNLSA